MKENVSTRAGRQKSVWSFRSMICFSINSPSLHGTTCFSLRWRAEETVQYWERKDFTTSGCQMWDRILSSFSVKTTLRTGVEQWLPRRTNPFQGMPCATRTLGFSEERFTGHSGPVTTINADMLLDSWYCAKHFQAVWFQISERLIAFIAIEEIKCKRIVREDCFLVMFRREWFFFTVSPFFK